VAAGPAVGAIDAGAADAGIPLGLGVVVFEPQAAATSANDVATTATTVLGVMRDMGRSLRIEE
jgi:hypothetical protein